MFFFSELELSPAKMCGRRALIHWVSKYIVIVHCKGQKQPEFKGYFIRCVHMYKLYKPAFFFSSLNYIEKKKAGLYNLYM